MAKKTKRAMSPEHREKLRQAYYARQDAKARGVHIPTQKEMRAAAKAKRELITEESVNKLIEEAPMTAQEGRVNNSTVTRYESTPNVKHPVRLRVVHQMVNHGR